MLLNRPTWGIVWLLERDEKVCRVRAKISVVKTIARAISAEKYVMPMYCAIIAAMPIRIPRVSTLAKRPSFMSLVIFREMRTLDEIVLLGIAETNLWVLAICLAIDFKTRVEQEVQGLNSLYNFTARFN